MANKDTEVICMMKESFSSIRDTRQQSQVRHDLYEIIAMTIAAVIGNCDGWDEIEDFCHSKESLRESGDKSIQTHSERASYNGRTVFMRN